MNFKRKNDNINLDQLVGKLQKEDNRYANICKGLKVVYWVLIPIYSLIAIDTYIDTKELIDLFAGLLFVGSFLIFAIIMGDFQKEYNSVDYSLPTLNMLKKAFDRYKPFRPKALWAVAAFFLMDAGFYLSSSFKDRVVDKQIYVLAIFLASVIVGLIIWYFKYKPLYDNSKRLIAEIEGE
ncbi:hypothetical protein DWB61_02635 [Ancylomarina euxinus]|uniref:Uncharacterized protein n=1 Tax=Ancylomarina euxinus TaxID=2283627 RepID=A0A425Y6A0_9BACT|nr:hypothetical protein [Ancylomarina euxinus]MCZ4694101.1 hypothetical protein [Ancylomarina euxinus]MUP15766.1 hypothetical protein [Ancylomarina euxinus]RRG24029.1 hypothetical protein DWB61_02635 [Ancylomarina euxinus]